MKPIFSFQLLAFIFSVLTSSSVSTATTKSYNPKVPAIYVFGDSIVDVGNNNYLPDNNSKANFPHYGIDFPHVRPTGRFSNGYNVIDFIAIQMGFPRSPPPYLSLNDTNSHSILEGFGGVNFASGGSGILDSTGTTITMTKQIQYFKTLRAKMLTESNADQVAVRLSKSIFLISSGGNDVFAFLSVNKSPNSSDVQLFYSAVVTNYHNQIKALYSLGARKFAVINLLLIGCCPRTRLQNPTGACVESINQIAKGLTNAMAALFARLITELPSFKYSIGNYFEFISTLIYDPNDFGFKEVKSACCGAGKLNAQFSCTSNVTYCSNRKQYIFWDRLHPSQETSKLVGSAFYKGPAKFVSPVNYKQLVENDD